MIKKLNKSHAKAAALLHQEGIPDDLLASFGIDFLTVLHELFIQSRYAICLGNFRNKKLCGILIGTDNTQKIFRQVLLHGFLKLLLPVMKQAIKNPRMSVKIIEAIRYPNSKISNSIKSELLILSVSTKHHRQGIGKELLWSFADHLVQKDLRNFKVSTKKSNLIANSFYQNIGGKFHTEFPIFNTLWNEYYFSF